MIEDAVAPVFAIVIAGARDIVVRNFGLEQLPVQGGVNSGKDIFYAAVKYDIIGSGSHLRNQVDDGMRLPGLGRGGGVGTQSIFHCKAGC